MAETCGEPLSCDDVQRGPLDLEMSQYVRLPDGPEGEFRVARRVSLVCGSGSGEVTSVSASSPLQSSGGDTPTISVIADTELGRMGNGITTVPSATNTDIGSTASNIVRLTGTTQIDQFTGGTTGAVRILHFDGAMVLTNNGGSMDLLGGNITTEAGAAAIMVCTAASNWRMVHYVNADGSPLNLTGGAYLVYNGLMNQSGAGNPTLSIKRNSTGATIDLTRASAGLYALSISGISDFSEVEVLLPAIEVENQTSGDSIRPIYNTSSVRIACYDSTGLLSDLDMSADVNIPLEIRIWT